MMTGTSLYKDSLNKSVANEGFTLRSMPVHDDLPGGYFFTDDGFRAENSTIIEGGVLRSFLLSLYGSRKTGLDRSANTGGIYVVDPGTDSFSNMVKSVDRGLLLCRFSGATPQATATSQVWPRTATT